MDERDTTPLLDPAARLRLDGRAYVVLGAGQGIGRQTAAGIARLGGPVLCVDIDPARADDVAAEVGGQPCAADVTDRDEMGRVFAAADAAFGRLDGVADIVGIATWGALAATTDDDW